MTSSNVCSQDGGTGARANRLPKRNSHLLVASKLEVRANSCDWRKHQSMNAKLHVFTIFWHLLKCLCVCRAWNQKLTFSVTNWWRHPPLTYCWPISCSGSWCVSTFTWRRSRRTRAAWRDRSSSPRNASSARSAGAGLVSLPGTCKRHVAITRVFKYVVFL